MTTYKTRFAELGYAKIARGLWRFVALDFAGDDGWHNGTLACVGPYYASKAELLGDLSRYAAQYGCENAV